MDRKIDSVGYNNPMSPNGPHPLYYVDEPDGTRHGPYSCRREAELAMRHEMAEIDPPMPMPEVE